MAENPSLEAVKGPLAGRRFEVGPGGFRLGRSSTCDIHVPDEELSRNHCLFEAAGPTGLRVTDLASANGTIVNGEPIGYIDPRYHDNIHQYFSINTAYYFRDAEGGFKRIRSIGALIRQFPERKRELRKAVDRAGYDRKRFDAACQLVLNLTSR